MSVKIMGAVWELDLTPAQKLVLLALADHADHDGRRIFPGIERIAWKTGYPVRSVRRIYRMLEDTGILERVTRNAWRGKAIEYRIVLERGVCLPELQRRT